MQCELVALSLVANFQPAPHLILSDSLCSLQLIKSWAGRSSAAILSCAERVEVRHFISQWKGHPQPPTLEKVKAHDTEGRNAGNPKSWGNEHADTLAKEAAEGGETLYSPEERFADAVQATDSAGKWIKDTLVAVNDGWWNQRRAEGAKRRTWLAQLYPAGLEFDWRVSGHLFRPPRVVEGKFVHTAAPPVIKWTARVRTGALATFARLATTGLKPTSQCPCCPVEVEDDAHAVSGCPGSGSIDCADFAARLWLKVGKSRGVKMIPLSPPWLQTHLLQVAAGLIPSSLTDFLPPDVEWLAPKVLQDFHLGMAERLAEVLRRRETVVGTAASSTSGASPSQAPAFSSSSSSARQLSVAELRAAERLPVSPQRRRAVASQQHLAEAKRTAALNIHRWIKEHRFLKAVPVVEGEASVALLLLWEADHAQLYPSQAVELVGRMSTFTKRLKEAAEADTELSQWFTCKKMHMQLAPGVPSTVYLRWAVQIDPAVGEPFLGSWKSHLLSLVRRHQSTALVVVDDSGPPMKRLKRDVQPRSRKRARSPGAPPPPLHTKQARIDRLKAAQAAAAGHVIPSSSSSSSVVGFGGHAFSSSTSSSSAGAGGPRLPGVASQAGCASPGAIT